MTKGPTAQTNSKQKDNVQSADTRLQRGILRLALSFRGQNVELDKRLKDLSHLAGSGRKSEKLARLMEEIIDTIVNQNISQNPEQRGGRSLSDLITKLLVQFPSSKGLKELQDALAMPMDQASLTRSVDKFVQIICELTSSSGDVTGESSSSVSDVDVLERFLENLRVEGKLNDDLHGLRSEIARRENQFSVLEYAESAANLISTALADTRASANDVNKLSSSREQLLLLMNLIPFPAELSERASRIRLSIERSGTVAELYATIPEIADVTAAMRRQLESELEELSEFLSTTYERLNNLEQLVADTNVFHEQSMTNTVELESTLDQQVDLLRSDVVEQTDVSAIRNAVSTRLDKLDETLHRFVSAENERHQDARSRVETMVTSLQELESETDALRHNLEEQHARVVLDPLTGILNRSGYDESIDREFRRWKRYQHNLSLAIIDLDLFKNINDTFGHSAGDKVLATVASQIDSQIRDSDILTRYGGEEFVIILPETDSKGAYALLEKLRIYIEQCRFHYKQETVPVTFSCGVTEFRPGEEIEDVFDRADKAMYEAKRNGRNRCRLAKNDAET